MQMPARKVAPLLDDPQAMQVIEVIDDDIEPLAEAVVLDDTKAFYVRQCESKVEEILTVISKEASEGEEGGWQVTGNEVWQVTDSDEEGFAAEGEDPSAAPP